MKESLGTLLMNWCRARRFFLLYVAVVFACFFVVYALYGYEWGVAGYAALLAAVAGLVLGVIDFLRFMAKHRALRNIEGRFPTAPLPEAATLLEEDYGDIVTALEEERRRLEEENAAARWDAQEYYTLWVHQIKTPMAALQLLLQSEEAAAPATPAMQQELFRIGQYVDMVLQYQRLSSLHSDLALQPFPVESLVRQAAKNCAPLFIYKKLPLKLDGVQGTVVTDQKWFVFVLEQLFTNAVKYTAKGEVRVYSRDAHTLVVEDTGRGIPPGDVPRVFERGFTGAAGRAERSSTGIGLFLCREILTRLGFSITLESTLGQGTQVFLHLRQAELQND